MTKKLKLFDVYRSATMQNPLGSRKEAFDRFLEVVKSNPSYLDDLAQECFDRMAAQYVPQKIGKSWSLVGTTSVKRRAEMSAERRVERAAEVTELVTEIAKSVRPFIWLEMLMPNGKKLRNCTGAELKDFGGIFLAISAKLKPTQVVDKHLREEDLRNLASRFEGGKRPAIDTERRVSA